jgi:hypothetical protein
LVLPAADPLSPLQDPLGAVPTGVENNAASRIVK